MSTTSEEIRIGQMAVRFRLEGEESGGSVAVFEFDVPAGARVPVAHSHNAYDETIYGLEGVLSWTLEGTKTDGGAGDGVVHPSWSRAPLRQRSWRRREDARNRKPRHPRPRVLPRDCRRHRGCNRRSTRPRSDRRSDETPRPHPHTIEKRKMSMSGVRNLKVWAAHLMAAVALVLLVGVLLAKPPTQRPSPSTPLTTWARGCAMPPSARSRRP